MVAGLLGATAVAAGALGAHALAATVTSERLAVWETASHYHLIHAVVLVVLALQSEQDDTRWKWPIIGFTVGVLLFSFSLYALVLTEVTTLAMITPVGGLVLILSWLFLFWRALK
jgi:uncharacterized membrane protein YgdD (TMEM256/DUF423 family)